jgi:guanine nucleotide-binding protein subunit alpha
MVMGCVSSTPESKRSDAIDDQLNSDRKRIKSEVKILLLGPGESGKSTIFKQMKIIQDGGGYTRDELLEYKYIIFANCISQMKCLVDAGIKLGMDAATPANKNAFQRMQSIPAGGDAWSIPVASDIKALWSDKGIRDIYAQRDKMFQLNDCASYFFDNIERFMTDNYIPTQDDVLRSRVRTTGIQEAEFKFEELTFRMLDVGGQRSERRKWIHCFDSVTAVMFCVALSEYDQVLREDATQNRMKESLLLFDEVSNSHWFKNTSFILFLNKTDLFKEKIARVDLTACWPSYTGGCNFENASTFIKQKFLEQNKTSHPIYTHFTCAISTENIEFVFRCVRETVLNEAINQMIVY